MKSLIASLLLTLSLGATAAQVTVYSDVHNFSASDVDITDQKFAVNPALGRTAVKFLLWDNTDDDGGNYDYKTEVVPGLNFDQATQNVMYQGVVCATTKVKNGIFGSKLKIYSTGNCTFSIVKEKVSVDDGFRLRTKNKISLLMNVL